MVKQLPLPNSNDKTLFQEMLSGISTGLVEETELLDYTSYASDPIGFFEDVLLIKNVWWHKLIEIAESVRDNPFTAVKSANSVGKTYTAGKIVVWWMQVFPYLCKVVTTCAPPERQIKELLWGEIRGTVNQSIRRGIKLHGGSPGVMQWKVDDNWWAQGFTIPQSGSSEDKIARFQGHHSPNLLYVIDEASGVPQEVFQAMDSCLSGGHNHVLLLSNPLTQSGSFYDATNDPNYNVITVSAFDHPNVVEGKIIIEGCITREKTEKRIREWSRPASENEYEDIATFKVPTYFSKDIAGTIRMPTKPYIDMKVTGRFPTNTDGALIPANYIRMAVDRWKQWELDGAEEDTSIPAVVGYDVAEMGADSNAFVRRRDNWVSSYIKWNNKNSLLSGGKAINEANKIKNLDVVCVDALNVGSGIAPQLIEANISALGVKVSERPTKKAEDMGEFSRLRDQLYWAMRVWFLETPDAMIPDEPELIEELLTMTYDIDYKGRIQVISKKSLKKLIGRSPDKMEALMLTFYPEDKWSSLDEFVRV